MRGTEWAPLYLLVVLAIAAILLVTFVKPLFRQAAVSAEDASKAAKDAAKSAMPFLAFIPFGRNVKKSKNAVIQMLQNACSLFLPPSPVPVRDVTYGGKP
ncbi:hypothetical protein HY994_03590 [Candidatus Micrarchaeota archaeon]|nr:hypothetical protein [Candidatus Micrarchaeota archaeon]